MPCHGCVSPATWSQLIVGGVTASRRTEGPLTFVVPFVNGLATSTGLTKLLLCETMKRYCIYWVHLEMENSQSQADITTANKNAVCHMNICCFIHSVNNVVTYQCHEVKACTFCKYLQLCLWFSSIYSLQWCFTVFEQNRHLWYIALRITSTCCHILHVRYTVRLSNGCLSRIMFLDIHLVKVHEFSFFWLLTIN